MQTLTRSASVRDRVAAWRASGGKIALVPTTGTLHKGHMSLVAEAQECAQHVVVSLVADAQHDGHTHEADRDLLTNLAPEVLFIPPVQELYPLGRTQAASVNLRNLTSILEGASRPGHLATTLTVLTKLFNMVRPDIALFGERDFQQLVMARRLVEDLFLPIQVVGCPTFRDGDGLALATANRELSVEQRVVAPLLYATLEDMAERIDAGDRDYAGLEHQGAQLLKAAGFACEYFVIRQQADLLPAQVGARELVIMAAVRLGNVRLNDSLPIGLIDRY
jgi:pantoate--beta-alanine ligase